MSQPPDLPPSDAIPAAEDRGFFAKFTQNHVAATLLALAFVVAGASALLTGSVRREVFPEITPNVVRVAVVYPGASPTEVETGVCQIIEEAVSSVTGIDKITSTASEGSGAVTIETLRDADVGRVLDDVKNQVDAITNLPGEIEKPIVSRLLLRKQVINVSISGDVGELALKRLAEQVRDELTALPEVTQVELAAVRAYEISVEVGEDALRRHGLTFDQVADAIRGSSLDLPAGAIKSDAGQTLLRVEGQAYRGREFEDITVLTLPDGNEVKLGEIATVRDGFADEDLSARFDSKPAALLKVFRVGDQDAIVITGAVRRWVAEQGRAQMPEGVEITTWKDESVILESRIELLLRNAGQGLILVFVILALFLQLRLAIWVAVGIPVAFLGAVAFMPVVDVSINMISLFAFLLVLGIVVDDAIVVGENIARHRRLGANPMLASIRGSREVRNPVFASVMTTMVAFLPMLFSVPGSDAQIWRVIPLIVLPVLALSLIESQLCLPSHLTLMSEDANRRPWLGARALGWAQDRVQGALSWIVERVYQPVLELCLRWRYTTIAAAAATFLVVVAMVAAGMPRFVFFPTVEGDNIVVSLTMPQGTPIERTTAALADIERTARALCDEFDREQPSDGPLLDHMLATVGSQPYSQEQAQNGGNRDAQFQSGSHLGELNLQLLRSELRAPSSDEIMATLRERVGTVPDAVELTYTTSFFSTGKDIDVELYHADMDVLRQAVASLQSELATMPEVKDVASSFRLGKREIELRIKESAEPLGLSQRDLARQVRQAFYGEEAQRIQRGRDDVKVMVRYPEAERRSVRDLEQMRIRTAAGDEVPLSVVAEVTSGRSSSTITRVDQKRALRVSGDIDENDPSASAEAVNARIRDEIMPRLMARHHGLSWAFEGDQKKKTELLISLAGGFVIALFAMYALMAIPLHSFLQPVLIITAIPFGFVGAVLGHMLTGYDLSILSMFGVIALSGVVVNDNIVLVDWINKRRKESGSLLDAVRSAGAARFRPILLTSLTTFFGLLPLLLERSVQARFLVPMGVSLAFGVLFATLITLVLVPCMYLVLADVVGAVRRSWRWLYGRRDEATPAAADA
ncbi:MAG: efflux RND transporter permease subunit [Planctomycetes bacterium]|nr:efflux RND transporter permease subunit [Planctomycetota bacterium]